MYLDEAVTTITQFDTPIAWMYLDKNGKVCVGTHHRLIDVHMAQELPFHRWTAAEATREEIAQEYDRIKQQRPGFTPSAYHRSDSLLLPKAAMMKVLRETLVRCAVMLSASFPDYDVYPDTIKVALLDMCYDVSLPYLSSRLCEAVGKQNWALASTLCRRDDASSERNNWTRRQFVDVAVEV
jgi:hypothetical protein